MNTSTSFLAALDINPTPTSFYKMEKNVRTITLREQEVLHLIAYEHSSKEIASKLFISYETVNSHRKNIMSKLGAKNTAGVIRMAFEKRLLHIAMTALIMFSAVNYNLSAQVINDDKFHYELYIGFLQILDDQDGGFTPTDEWVPNFIYATDTDGIATDLGLPSTCGRIFRLNGVGASAVGPDHDGDEVIDGRANIEFEVNQDENNFNQKAIDIDLRVFEDDTNDPTRAGCGDCACGPKDLDENLHQLLIIDPLSVDNFFANQNFAGAIGFTTTGALVSVAYAWRYAIGQAEHLPLIFEDIPFGGQRTHLNSNRIKPVLDPSDTALGIHNTPLNYRNEDGSPNRSAGEVYYSFTIDSKSKVTISTDNATTTASTFLVLKDDGVFKSSGNMSIAPQILSAGTYTITVDGYNGGGLFELSVLRESLPAPVNDVCSSAITLNTNASDCSTTVYNSLGATGTILLQSCDPLDNDNDEVWFQFVGTGVKQSSIEVVGDSDFEPAFEVYASTCPDGNSVVYGCSTPQSDSHIAIFNGFFALGTSYFVRVYDRKSGFIGEQSFSICVSDLNAETCKLAIPLACGVTVSGDNTGKDISSSAPNCYVADNPAFFHRAQWYSFIGDGSTVTLTLSNNNFNSVIFLYTGPCDNLVCGSLVVGSSVIYHTISGTDYKVLIAGNDTNEFGSFDLTMTCRDESEICNNGYVGVNKLIDAQYIPMEFRTNGSIESEQSIFRASNVLYSAGTSSTSSVSLLPKFSVSDGNILEVNFTGCETSNKK